MSALPGARRGATLYLLASAMLGVLLAGLVAVATGAGPAASLLFALPLALVFASASGFSAYYLCRTFPLGRGRLAVVLAVFTLSAASVALLWTAAGAAWATLLDAMPGEGATPVMSRPLAAAMFALGVLLYWMTAVAHYLAIEHGRARQAETRELQLRLMARDAELRMLRTQVDPHFLFNSLNSISALTSIDPAAARRMTVRLAEFFRHTLGLEAHRKVTLDDELALAERFLEIEQVRFGNRLAFGRDVGEGAGRCLLPPMLLQPLVENAVKHGIGQLIEGGEVRVQARRAGSILRIRVENDAGDTGATRAPGGIGLANVRQRLVSAYGHEGSVRWTHEDGRFRVDIELPAQTIEENETCES